MSIRRRPETAYSISRYSAIPGASGEIANVKPHTTLEQRKFANQMTICYVSPRRQTLIKSTDIKTKKEIYEWIQNDHPNGIEILSKIAMQTRSNYKALINKALSDLRIVEKRANLMDKKDLEEKSKNSDEVENQIIEYEKKLQKAKEENKRLKNELNNGHALYLSMDDDMKRLQSVLKNVKSKLISNADECDNDHADQDNNENENENKRQQSSKKDNAKQKIEKIDNDQALPSKIRIEMLKEEEKRLEQDLIKLETRLMELTLEERSLLYGQFLPSTSDNS